MGTHVVAARPMQPVPWALQKPQNCCCVGWLVTLENFSHFNFFRNPFVAPSMGLGDHLMTIRYLSTHGNPCSGHWAQLARPQKLQNCCL